MDGPVQNPLFKVTQINRKVSTRTHLISVGISLKLIVSDSSGEQRLKGGGPTFFESSRFHHSNLFLESQIFFKKV
jgi:hypothetical protein